MLPASDPRFGPPAATGPVVFAHRSRATAARPRRTRPVHHTRPLVVSGTGRRAHGESCGSIRSRASGVLAVWSCAPRRRVRGSWVLCVARRHVRLTRGDPRCRRRASTRRKGIPSASGTRTWLPASDRCVKLAGTLSAIDTTDSPRRPTGQGGHFPWTVLLAGGQPVSLPSGSRTVVRVAKLQPSVPRAPGSRHLRVLQPIGKPLDGHDTCPRMTGAGDFVSGWDIFRGPVQR